MEERIYKYRFSRRVLYWSIVHLLIFISLALSLYGLYEGGFLSAWFSSCIAALLALMILSIPRKIIVDKEKISIHCLLDMTEIQRQEIASVRRIENEEMKGLIPIFGGCGFFGYYGHFFDLHTFERVKIYASEWNNFVEIIDIYEDRYYVSCTQADDLVLQLKENNEKGVSDPEEA
ncbi:MAG: PH domain-containing protein [Alistipes sp.]